jgi:nicotinamide-nucleotide amidase
MTESDLADLEAGVGAALLRHGSRLVAAESCTGGLVAARLTEVPGSSEWFEGAFVTYRLSAKTDMIGVGVDLLERHGAVSEPVARAMAEGALAHCRADISVAITGVAGPAGGDVVTPVGTVWFGWAVRDEAIRCVQTAEHHLTGGRQAVREQAVEIALAGVLTLLANDSGGG